MHSLGAWRRVSVVGSVCLVTACGNGEMPDATSEDPRDGGSTVEACPAGHVRGRAGQCMPVGIQGCAAEFIDEDGVCRPSASKCPAGSLPKFDTGCVPVGISECAPEFLEDDGLCHPSMAKCPAGTFAVPSDGCVPVDGPTGCGAGTWGNIVEAPGDLHVSAAAPDASGDGSRAKPYKTIDAAMMMAGSGDRVVLAEGVYDEPVAIYKDIELIGVCPSKVRIQGSMIKNDTPIVILVQLADKVVLRDIEIGGDGVGVFAVLVGEVLLERVHVKNASSAGVVISGDGSKLSLMHSWIDTTLPYNGEFGVGVNAQGGAWLSLDSSAITASRGAGLYASHATTEVHLMDTLIEGTLPDNTQTAGYGLQIDRSAALLAEQIAVVKNREVGMAIEDKATRVELRRSQIEGTLPREATNDLGYGVHLSIGAEMLLEQTVIKDNRGAGVVASDTGTKLSMEGCLITGTQSTNADSLGIGVVVVSAATASVNNCSVTMNEAVGFAATGAGTHVMASGDDIEGTLAHAGSDEFGKGIEVSDGAYVELVSSALLSNRYVGASVGGLGTELVLKANLIDGTLPQLSDGKFGRGAEVGYGAKLTMSANHLNRNHDISVGALSSTLSETSSLTMNGDYVSNTLAREINGEWGVGLYADAVSLDVQSAVFTNNLVAGMIIRLSTANVLDTLIDGVPSGKFTLQNPVETFEDVCDGLLVRDGSTVSISGVEARNCCRAGLLFQESSGSVANTTSTQNRFGLVLQGMPRPVLEATNEFKNNTERDEWFDGDLPVPDALPALP